MQFRSSFLIYLLRYIFFSASNLISLKVRLYWLKPLLWHKLKTSLANTVQILFNAIQNRNYAFIQLSNFIQNIKQHEYTIQYFSFSFP